MPRLPYFEPCKAQCTWLQSASCPFELILSIDFTIVPVQLISLAFFEASVATLSTHLGMYAHAQFTICKQTPFSQ